MCDEAMYEIEPLLVPADDLRAYLIPRQNGDFPDKVEMCTGQSDPTTSSYIIRKQH